MIALLWYSKAMKTNHEWSLSMEQIIAPMAIENLKINLHANSEDINTAVGDMAIEEDFASAYAAFESEYQKLIKDLDDEISRRSQK
jgi:hypothetical protein